MSSPIYTRIPIMQSLLSLSLNFQSMKIYPNDKTNITSQIINTVKANDILTESINKIRIMLYPIGEKAIFGLQTLFNQFDRESTRRLVMEDFIAISSIT